jgi:hypothetical protein
MSDNNVVQLPPRPEWASTKLLDRLIAKGYLQPYQRLNAQLGPGRRAGAFLPAI